MIKLFFSPASPYARKVRVLAIELELNKQIQFIHCHPFDNQAQLLNLNPLGKVPVLEIDGGCILDSSVICDYLLQLSTLSKPSAEDFWQQRTALSIAQGLLDIAVAWRRETMREEKLQSDFWQQRSLQASVRSLQWFEQRIDKVAAFPDLTAITLACALEYFCFRHPQFDWQQSCVKLANWLNGLQHRESIKTTKPTI